MFVDHKISIQRNNIIGDQIINFNNDSKDVFRKNITSDILILNT